VNEQVSHSENPHRKVGVFYLVGLETEPVRPQILSGKGCMTLTMTKELKLVLLVDFIWKRVYDTYYDKRTKTGLTGGFYLEKGV